MSVGTPVARIHWEPKTDQCICHRATGCGWVDGIVPNCPEHGGYNYDVRFHTHAMQVDRISVGTLIA